MKKMFGKINFFVVFGFLLVSLSCGERKSVEVQAGKLKFVKTIRYGKVGTHGSNGWYVTDRQFYVNDKNWSPENINVKENISDCETSPNKTIEVLKCASFADRREIVYILRMNNGEPEWITASNAEYNRGTNFGEWTNEGRWLLFRNYFFNVETSEKKLVKTLPEDPENYFRTASPDLKTIVYRESSFVIRDDLPRDTAARDEEMKRQWAIAEEHIAGKITAFWLIDAETGAVEILEIEKDKFDWLDWKQEKFPSRRDWLEFFQRQFIWKKDKNGKYQIVQPK